MRPVPADPDRNHPLRIEPGLDRAVVRVLVEPPARQTARRRALGSFGGLVGLLLLCLSPDALGALAALFAASVVFAAWIPPSKTPYVLRFEADASGPIFRGRRVAGEADYLSLTLDGVRYVIPRGLTKGEHRRLMALLRPEERGSEEDVPRSLQELSET